MKEKGFVNAESFPLKKIPFPQKVLVKGDGMNQLDEYIGHPKKGDIVKVSFKGHVKSTGKEFEDTYNLLTLVPIEIGSDYDAASNASTIKWTKGLAMAVEGMVLGDECELVVKSDYAFGVKGKKCNFGTVGPNEDVIFTVALRHINHHHRKIKTVKVCCNWNFGWNTMT